MNRSPVALKSQKGFCNTTTEQKSDPYCRDDPSTRSSGVIDIDDPLTFLQSDTQGECTYSRILIQRDYTEWPTMRFSTNVPPVLVRQMHVKESVWSRTFEEINKICAEINKVSWRTALDTLAYCVFLPRKNNTEKCLERLSAYIAKENDTIYREVGLDFKNPGLNGYRYIEVVVNYLRFRTSKPILLWGVDDIIEPALDGWLSIEGSGSYGSSTSTVVEEGNDLLN